MKFISYIKEINTVNNFDDMDDSITFEKNLKKQPADWIYRNKKIQYVFNDQGFRINQKIDDINWSESIVFFGCSETFGCGLAEEDTFPKQVEKMLGIPTINLGISGSAVDLAFMNSTILFDHYPRPKAIVHMWTNLARYTHLMSEKKHLYAARFLPTTPGYIGKIHWEERSKFYVKAERAIWKDFVPRYETTFTPQSAEAFGVKLVEIVDRARDCFHPGIETNYRAALAISKNLKEVLKK
jgi:hypothetical protein